MTQGERLDIDDIQDIGKYIFSVANGNHILNYSEKEYRHFLIEKPEKLENLFLLYFISSNWGYDDVRMFDNYDEQWLAQQIDTSFKSKLSFELADFSYQNLLPYQKAVVDFTTQLRCEIKDWTKWLQGGSLMERIYSVFANNLHLNTHGEVINKKYAIQRGLEMFKLLRDSQYQPSPPFEDWELVIY
ncbi:MAG: hypothetical protein MI810_13685 [Flavobacteriales bacterium]|nr:hypothetical protein [Flavobacteriales bacterium]